MEHDARTTKNASATPHNYDGMSDEELEAAACAAGEQAAAEDFAADAQKLQHTVDELTAQIDEARTALDAEKEKAAKATDSYLRLQADWDNYRRRTAQERLDERAVAAQNLVVSVLPVIDDMERALSHAETIEDKDENFTNFVDGVLAVHDKLLGILAKHDVEVMDPAGEVFDPMIHEAVGQCQNPDVYADTVADVYRKGYRMAGKVIRTAMVTVTCGGPRRPSEPADNADVAAAAAGVAGESAVAGEGAGAAGVADAAESAQNDTQA